MSEKVLVFPRCKIEEAKSGLLLGEYDYLFIDREDAEASEDFVQLIPYTVFVKGNQILNYSRTKKGGEARLHDKRSVGIGGHINPVDGDNVHDAYDNALGREVEEEIGVSIEKYNRKKLMCIYDDSDEVGKVHFGVVYTIAVGDNFEIGKVEENLTDVKFTPIDDLDVDKFENWSRIVIEKLGE